MKFNTAFIVLLSAMLTSGCATIINGSTQTVEIASEPEGASIMIDGEDFGTTPASVDLKRKTAHVVSIALPGYETQELTLERKTSGWVWGNIIFGGLIGLVVDISAGGMYKLTPEQLAATLESDPSAGLGEGESRVFVQMVAEPQEGWQKVGTLKPVEGAALN